MKNKPKTLRNLTSAAAFAAALGLAHGACATDSFPGDDTALPPGTNIVLFYNEFSNAGSFGPADGGRAIDHSTRFVDAVTALRFVHYFSLGGYTGVLQGYLPYAGFLGNQELGLNPSAATLGQSAHASLSKNNGFAQPNLGAAIFAINHPAEGDYLVLAPWISPPLSSFNRNDNLNPAQNIWQYEMDVAARHILSGTPATRNLAVSFFVSGYVFSANRSSALVTPAITIPAYGVTTAPVVTGATFHEQPSLELRAYVPYEFHPATDAFFAPGIFQSFGGKQYYNIHGGPAVDSGSRTNETQLRFVTASFVSPTLQLMLIGEYDLANHGGPLDRNLELRLATLF